MDMTINLKNKNDDLLVETLTTTDQAIITNMIMEKINVWFLLDAWEPDEVKGMKVSFVFVDEELFEGMKETLQRAKLHNEMSLILMDVDDYRVIKEVWIPGDYEQLSNISVFEIPAPNYNDDYMNNDINKYGLYTYEDFEDYIPYEVFEYMFPAKYFKVAVGKEMISFEEIVLLIEKYLVGHDII